MTHTKNRALACLASATAAAALSVAALPGAAAAATRYETEGTYATVRNGPGGDLASGYVLGNLYASSGAGPNVGGTEHFDLIRKSADGNWGYGYAYGHYGSWGGGHCGWVLMDGMHNTGTTTSASCPPVGGDSPSDDALDANDLFRPGTWVSGTGGGTVQPAVIVSCANPYAYGNYDPATGTFANKYPTALPVGRGTSGHPGVTSGYSGFGTRYQTADGRAWLIKDTESPAGGGHYTVPNWHFVRSECIQRF